MDIRNYLDSTYLKTPAQSGLSEAQTKDAVMKLAREAVENGLFAVMIRPEYVKEVKNYLQNEKSDVKTGTVIGFHEGTSTLEEKMAEAGKAIEDGADELDFVINYQAYLKGNTDVIKAEVLECTSLCLQHNKIAKWIIEAAALSEGQIADITDKIAAWVTEAFPGKEADVFVKSSTGFYVTEGGKPNGATFENIKIMLDNSGKLPVKAAGGVRTPKDAEKMIEMGVKRIGTSSAMALVEGNDASIGY